MPSASAAGAAAYLERRRETDAPFARALDGALAALERLSREAGAPFAGATRDRRIAALLALETQQPPLFAELRDAAYEAYYTNPDVQRLIGYDFRGGTAQTAALPAFDESSLERVRHMDALLRGAD
jgi:hypothetical protein